MLNKHLVWSTLKEKRDFKFLGTLEIPYIRRNDGLTIRQAGGGREFEIFQCDGDFGRFAFYASRQDEFNIWDQYIVQTRMTPSRHVLNLNSEDNENLIRIHAKDIESALLYFPPGRSFDYKPVKKVLFELETPLIDGRPNKKSRIVSADEV